MRFDRPGVRSAKCIIEQQQSLTQQWRQVLPFSALMQKELLPLP